MPFSSPRGSITVVSHLPQDAIGGAPERARGLVEGLRDLGLQVDWQILTPDTAIRHRRPTPWWFHRLSNDQARRLRAATSRTDALLVCYLPVADALLPIAEELSKTGRRIIYSADNDEVAVARVARGRLAQMHIAKMQDRVMRGYPEVWVAGTRDCQNLARAYPSPVIREVPSGVRHGEVVSPPKLGPPRAFTYGSWTYPPNVDGLERLLTAGVDLQGQLLVFGKPNEKLERRIARNSAGGSLKISWRGFADSVSDMPAEARGAAVVPVWKGAGTKLRIVELAERGIPAYAPPHAFDGLPAVFREYAGGVEEDPRALLQAAFSAGPNEWSRARVLSDTVSRDFSVTEVVRRAWTGECQTTSSGASDQ